MWLLVGLVLSGGGWFLFRRWRRNLPLDQRLTLPYWRNSLFVVGAYLLSILLGAGITRIMVGFNRSGWADLLMVAFFLVWVLYGAVWLLRYLPTTRPPPAPARPGSAARAAGSTGWACCCWPDWRRWRAWCDRPVGVLRNTRI